MTVNTLNFHPWIVRRTHLYEYFSRSWGMFAAAESSKNSATAAMLVGLSFELALKTLLVICTPRTEFPPNTHRISGCLGEIPQLKKLLQDLWGEDLDFVVQFVDEDINSSQIRYGAAGSKRDKETRLVAATFAEKPSYWADSVRELYEELMGSIGAAIWENYPKTDKNGKEFHRRFEISPALKPGIAVPPDMYPGIGREVFGYFVGAKRRGIDTESGAIIPMEGRSEEGEFWVRIRIEKDTAVDQKLTQIKGKGLRLEGQCRWVGQPVDGVSLHVFQMRSILSQIRGTDP